MRSSAGISGIVLCYSTQVNNHVFRLYLIKYSSAYFIFLLNFMLQLLSILSTMHGDRAVATWLPN